MKSYFSCKESKSFEMELETRRNTFEPFFHNGWARNRIVAGVTLHTRKDPGIMQQTILCCLHRARIEPSTLDNGRIRPSTSSLENFSHEITYRSTFPRHFLVAGTQSPLCVLPMETGNRNTSVFNMAGRGQGFHSVQSCTEFSLKS